MLTLQEWFWGSNKIIGAKIIAAQQALALDINKNSYQSIQKIKVALRQGSPNSAGLEIAPLHYIQICGFIERHNFLLKFTKPTQACWSESSCSYLHVYGNVKKKKKPWRSSNPVTISTTGLNMYCIKISKFVERPLYICWGNNINISVFPSIQGSRVNRLV